MLEIQSVNKSFAGVDVLRDISLSIPQGDFFSIVGPSGCGKSTLLRVLAGLEAVDSGLVSWCGTVLTNHPAHLRPFNMVFQRYALFPHMTVRQNVGFGPAVKHWSLPDQRRAVDEALELVQLRGLGDRRIETLSGGQQQRVALARAIANKPEVLLLDEPMSALDQKLRDQMRIELLRIQRTLGITFIMVTHDQEEALTMSDKIAILNQGQVVQCGSPEDVYRCPKSSFVANFVGNTNTISIDCEKVFVRPEDIEISLQAFSHAEDYRSVSGRVVIREILFKGAVTDYVVDIDAAGGSSRPLIIQKPSSFRQGMKVNDRVYIRWRKDSQFGSGGLTDV